MSALPERWLDGIGARSCPIACTVEKCVITGENICGHPSKGGLQPKYQQMKDVFARHGEARHAIKIAKER